MFKTFLLICLIAFVSLNICKTEGQEGDAESDDSLDSCEFECYMYQQCALWVSGSGGDPNKTCGKPAECNCDSFSIP